MRSSAMPQRAPRRSAGPRRRAPAGRSLREQAVQVAQQRAAAGEHHAALGDVRRVRAGSARARSSRWRRSGSAVGQRLQDLVGRDGEAAWHTFAEVTALTSISFTSLPGKAEPIFLDRFRGRLADQHAVVAGDVVMMASSTCRHRHAPSPCRPCRRARSRRPRWCRRRCRRPSSRRLPTPAGRHRSPRPSAPRSGRPRWRRAQRRFADRAALDLGRAAGHQMMMRGLGFRMPRGWTILMNCLSICSVTVKSAMTPSFSGGWPRCCRAPCRAWPWPRHRPPGWSSCRWVRPRGGWRRRTARRARCPCHARR